MTAFYLGVAVGLFVCTQVLLAALAVLKQPDDHPNHPTTKERIRVKVTIEGSELVIRIPMQPPTPSASGKTLVVASTRGNAETEARVDGKPVIVGLNAYIYANGR